MQVRVKRQAESVTLKVLVQVDEKNSVKHNMAINAVVRVQAGDANDVLDENIGVDDLDSETSTILVTELKKVIKHLEENK